MLDNARLITEIQLASTIVDRTGTADLCVVVPFPHILHQSCMTLLAYILVYWIRRLYFSMLLSQPSSQKYRRKKYLRIIIVISMIAQSVS